MTEKEQKALIDRVESLENDIKNKTSAFELLVGLWLVATFTALLVLGIYFTDYKQDKKEEELRKIICDIHKDTNTPAPKYDFKANKFVTSGYKYDPNLVKKLYELCKSNTH